MELQNFFPTNGQFLAYFGPNFLLQLVNGGFGIRILCVIVQPPKPTFLLDEIQDGLTNRRFRVAVAVHFKCGCVDCIPPVRLELLCWCQYWLGCLSVCCVDNSSFVLSNR